MFFTKNIINNYLNIEQEEWDSKSNDINVEKGYKTHLKCGSYVCSVCLEKESTKMRIIPQANLWQKFIYTKINAWQLNRKNYLILEMRGWSKNTLIYLKSKHFFEKTKQNNSNNNKKMSGFLVLKKPGYISDPHLVLSRRLIKMCILVWIWQHQILWPVYAKASNIRCIANQLL